MLKKIFIAILLFSTPQAFSQGENPKFKLYLQTFEDAKKNSTKYLKKVKEEYKGLKNGNMEGKFKKIAVGKYVASLDQKTFMKIIKLQMDVFDEDLFQMSGYSTFNHLNIKQKNEGDFISLGLYRGMLSKRLGKIYEESKVDLILLPLLLDIKILDTKLIKYDLGDGYNTPKIIISAKIVDIAKGNKHYSVGDILEFYYFPSWMHTKYKLINGNDYFVALSPVYNDRDDSKSLALSTNDKNDGIIEIKNNTILDEENYYGYGEISWDEFKEKILQIITIE